MGGPAIINGKTYDEFDNFNTDYPFEYDGKQWLSVEQLYQAMKFSDESYREQIRQMSNMSNVYFMGQSRRYNLVDGFCDDMKVENMYRAMYARISQHEDLSKLLVHSSGYIEVPHSDTFWGTNYSTGGLNWNGKLLENIREKLSGQIETTKP